MCISIYLSTYLYRSIYIFILPVYLSIYVSIYVERGPTFGYLEVHGKEHRISSLCLELKRGLLLPPKRLSTPLPRPTKNTMREFPKNNSPVLHISAILGSSSSSMPLLQEQSHFCARTVRLPMRAAWPVPGLLVEF